MTGGVDDINILYEKSELVVRLEQVPPLRWSSLYPNVMSTTKLLQRCLFDFEIAIIYFL